LQRRQHDAIEVDPQLLSLSRENSHEVAGPDGRALPLSTAYSVCEYAGIEAAVDDSFAEVRPFCLAFGMVAVIGAGAVLIPNIPLVTILVSTQVLNTALLMPILLAMIGIACVVTGDSADGMTG
jgi:hypothetical protein